MIKYVARLLCIRGVPGSNLSPAIVTYAYCGFPQSFQTSAELVPQIVPQPFPAMSNQIHYSLLSYSLTLYSLSY